VNGKRLKKWFMLQVWRVQQVAQILTLVLLAVTDSKLLWDAVNWRGGIIADPYLGPLVIMIAIGLAVWAFAIFWDLRLRMWREQMNVTVERNPYAKERLTSKEVFMYSVFYMPVIESLAKNDPRMKEYADILAAWFKKETTEDPNLLRDMKEILGHIGSDRVDIIDAIRNRKT